MYSFEIQNKNTRECNLIFGYSLNDAFRRAGLDSKDWTCLLATFED